VAFDCGPERASCLRWRRYRSQLFDQPRRARGADFGIDLDQTLDDLAQGWRNVRGEVSKRSPVTIEDPLHRLNVVSAVERADSSSSFEQDYAEREQVRSSIDGVAAHMLGRHVGHLALCASACRHGRVVDRFRDAEVCELGFTRSAQQDVGGRDVTVNEGAVRMFERVRQVQCDQSHRVRRQLLFRARFEKGAKIDTVHELEGHVVYTVDLADIDHANDIGVAKTCREFGLPPKTRNEHVILAERGKHPLQTNTLLECACSRTRCFERLRHASHTEAAY
jgi:hypothetical protein